MDGIDECEVKYCCLDSDDSAEKADEQKNNWQVYCRAASGRHGTGQTTEPVHNIDLPAHSRVCITLIVDHVRPRVVRTDFDIGRLSSYKSQLN